MSYRYADRQQVFYNGDVNRLSDKPTAKPTTNPNLQRDIPLYSMKHAPTDGRRVFVTDENGRKRRAMFDRNAWRVVGVEIDRISGERRFQQTGDIIHQPTGFHWPIKRS
jgi:hypothetical protein